MLSRRFNQGTAIAVRMMGPFIIRAAGPRGAECAAGSAHAVGSRLHGGPGPSEKQGMLLGGEAPDPKG